MRISKIMVALLVSVVALTAMTGVAVAEDEQIELLPDGSISHPNGQTSLASPLVINNDGVTSTEIDIGLWDYLLVSPAGQSHTMKVWLAPISPGALASDITITVTERSGGATATGVGTSAVPLTLTWTQDNAGNSVPSPYDYIDLGLVSTGPDGAQYQLNVEDTGYGTIGGALDHDLENLEVHNVPEFATIAIPAIAVLGLFLFFNKRKHKKD
ncbi:hypothetical protein C5S31_03115 [ANME-1 cluster archaeon GoMg2]|nr:hypothetical protein [ANME-1 cluster archaeon GoMg2]